MRRRDFIVALGGTVGWPLAVRAQGADRMRRLGVLMALAENDAEGKKYIASFVQGLHDLDWTEGANIRIEYRWAGTDVDRIRGAAAELLDFKPDAILAMTPLAVAPLRQMTATVPIVFVQVTDPVASGIAHRGSGAPM
jgi:putative tryptophan/tyrosine transport system substrate-binding protein